MPPLDLTGFEKVERKPKTQYMPNPLFPGGVSPVRASLPAEEPRLDLTGFEKVERGFDLGNIGTGIRERSQTLVSRFGDVAANMPPVPIAGVAPLPPPISDIKRYYEREGAPRSFDSAESAYVPGTTWEEVKREPIRKFLPYAFETGLVSTPDMAMSLLNLPAYIAARTGEIGRGRGEAEGREDPTVEDLVKALPAAIAVSLLERIGARGVTGIGDALVEPSLKEIAKATAKGATREGATEMAQTPIELGGQFLGTEAGMPDIATVADQMLAAGAAGFGFGGPVRATTATGQALVQRAQQQAAMPPSVSQTETRQEPGPPPPPPTPTEPPTQPPPVSEPDPAQPTATALPERPKSVPTRLPKGVHEALLNVDLNEEAPYAGGLLKQPREWLIKNGYIGTERGDSTLTPKGLEAVRYLQDTSVRMRRGMPIEHHRPPRTSKLPGATNRRRDLLYSEIDGKPYVSNRHVVFQQPFPKGYEKNQREVDMARVFPDLQKTKPINPIGVSQEKFDGHTLVHFDNGVAVNSTYFDYARKLYGEDATFQQGDNISAPLAVLKDNELVGVIKPLRATESPGIAALRQHNALMQEPGVLTARPGDAGSTARPTGTLSLTAGADYVSTRPQTYNPDVPRTDGGPVSREAAMRDLATSLGFATYVGRIPKRSKASGFFRPANEELRVGKAGDLETFIHEAAHLLDKRFPEIEKQWAPANNANQVYREELRGVSYDKSKLFEGFAEFVRLWATQPEEAIARAPNFTAWWESFLTNHPGEAPAIRKFKEQALQWFNQSAIDRARSKIGTPVDVNEGLTPVFSQFRQTLSDDLAGIYRMERDLMGTIQPEGAYQIARLTRGKAAFVGGILLHGAPVIRDDGSHAFKGKGLQQILKPLGEKLDDFLLYAVGRAARELKSQGREKLFTQPEIDAMLALRRPQFDQAFAEYQTWNKAILDFAQAKGVIDPNARAAWKRMEYIPFHRVMEGTGEASSFTGKPGDWAGIQRLKGGDRNIRPVLENIIKNATMLMDAAITNEARVEVARLAMNGKGARYMTRIPKVPKPVKIMKDQIKSAILRSLGVTKPEALPVDMQVTFDQMTRGLEQMTTFFRLGQAPPGNNVVAILRRGKPTYFEVADPILYRSLTSLTRPRPGRIRRTLGFFRRLGQLSITLWPDFIVANIARDTIMGAVMSRNGFRPFIDSARGLRSRLTSDPDYLEFIANGGGFSSYLVDEDAYRVHLRQFYTRKGIDPKSVLDLGPASWLQLEKIADAFEMATRLGEYKRAKAAGATPREAAYRGREVSTDFAMRGDSQTIGAMYDTIIFLKPMVNALDRLYRGVAHDPQKGHIAYKTAMLAAVSMGIYMINRGNPLYDELEDWDRDNHWHFFIPTAAYYDFHEKYGRDPQTSKEAQDLFEHFRYPKIWEVGALASMAERMLDEVINEGDQNTAAHIGRIFGDLMGFEYVPAVVQPIYDQLLNKDRFTDVPIVGMALEGLEPYAQSRAYTSPTMRALGEATRDLPPELQISPVRAEHLIRGYLHSWGMYGLSLSDAMFFDDLPDMRLDQMPAIRRFYKQQPARSTRYVTEFYEMLEEATATRRTMREMARRGQPEALQQHIEDAEDQMYGVLSRANDRAGALRRQINAMMFMDTVPELQAFAEAWSRSSGDNKMLAEARKSGTWNDKGALKALLRDALINERNLMMEQVVKAVKERQRAEK